MTHRSRLEKRDETRADAITPTKANPALFGSVVNRVGIVLLAVFRLASFHQPEFFEAWFME